VDTERRRRRGGREEHQELVEPRGIGTYCLNHFSQKGNLNSRSIKDLVPCGAVLFRNLVQYPVQGHILFANCKIVV